MYVDIFCEIFDFCKELEKQLNVKLLGNSSGAGRKPSLSVVEIMAISIYFHSSGFKCFKAYYNTLILNYERWYFINIVSYNRFIELRQQLLIPLMLFSQRNSLGKCDGISFIDSTKLEVCHARRALSHKLFKRIAKKGKTSTGWFFGFKLHCVINSRGEIIAIYITPGNVADNNPRVLDALTQNVSGKLIADKGYIGAFKQLFKKGITLIHGLRKNMKNKLMHPFDKWLLRRRGGAIETVLGVLKESCALVPTKSRSKSAYFVHIFSAVAAYHFRPNKPSIFPLTTAIESCSN